MKINIIKSALVIGSLVSMTACTKLDEKLNSTITVNNAITPDQLLRSTYNSMQDALTSQDRFISLSEHSTDEMCGPTRATDWDDNGVWRVIHTHNWNADHAQVTATFENLLIMQYNASVVLNFNPTPAQAAEAHFLRAFSMWAVLDGWNQVPFRAIGSSLSETPVVLKGAVALDTIINELNAALPNLTDGPKNRANKNGARALLMKCYLNKAVYAGDRKTMTFAAADMQQVATLADQITASGAYSLAANYFDNFAATNKTIGTENIYTYGGGVDENQGRGGNNIRTRWFMTMHYNQNPGGWNGFTTLSDFYDKFDASDKRRGVAYPVSAYTNPGNRVNVGFLAGQQYNLSNDAPLNDRPGSPLVFSRAVALQETNPATLEMTGIRCAKYVPDFSSMDNPNNEFAFFRYGDVLLMKAEALMRSGDNAGALAIVNNLRSVRGTNALASLDAAAMIDERGREMYWEGWRRNDMIRFGTFLNANQLKSGTSANTYLLFPIPNNDLAANPNLKQNPGY